jgi:hypothetical protein
MLGFRWQFERFYSRVAWIIFLTGNIKNVPVRKLTKGGHI